MPHVPLELEERNPLPGPSATAVSSPRDHRVLPSDNAVHPADPSLGPPLLQAHVVLCLQGHGQGMSPALCSRGPGQAHPPRYTQPWNRHMPSAGAKPTPAPSPSLGPFWKPLLPGQFRVLSPHEGAQGRKILNMGALHWSCETLKTGVQPMPSSHPQSGVSAWSKTPPPCPCRVTLLGDRHTSHTPKSRLGNDPTC